MGVDTRKPPLPAPTEDPTSMDDTDLATDLSRRTDRTSYSIPEDGSPITISTHKLTAPKEGRLGHGRQKSQTSLLIEYFEGGKHGDKGRSKPSVRVKVTPSAARKNKAGSDAVQITGIGKDRKPSYTRRISLGSKTETNEKVIIDGTDLSRSTEDSNLSGRPPIEVEVLDPNASDLSTRDLRYLPHSSDISSMPPDSLLEMTGANGQPDSTITDSTKGLRKKRSRSLDRVDQTTSTHLEAPGHSRTRSLSRERITQRVLEKLAGRPLESTSRKSKNVEYEPETKPGKERERRRRSSRSHQNEEVTSPGSSQLSSGLAVSQTSYRSGNSKVSLNNPKLLEMVEDTVKRLILPELHQMRQEQKTSRNLHHFDDSRQTSAVDRDSYTTDLTRSVSKSSSVPNIRGKPKVVLNQYEDEPGQVLSRGDSERVKARKSSRDGSSGRHSRSSGGEVIEEVERTKDKSKKSHRARDAAAGALAGGILTAAALKHHNSRDKDHKGRTSSHGRRRSDSITESEERIYDRDEEATPRAHPRDEISELTETTYDGHGHGHGMHSPRHRRFDSQSEEIYDDGFSEGLPSRQEHALRHLRADHREKDHGQIRMPFSGGPTDSEITRDSILSASTGGREYPDGSEIETPLREVPRHNIRDVQSQDTITSGSRKRYPNHSPDGLSRETLSEEIRHSPQSSSSKHHGTKHAALAGAAAGIGGAALANHLANRHKDGHMEEVRTSSRDGSVRSGSARHDLNDPLIPQALRTRSTVTSPQSGMLPSEYTRSPLSSPGVNARSKTSPSAQNIDSFAARSRRGEFARDAAFYDDATPHAETVDDWLAEEHKKNEYYRDSLATDSLTGSYSDDKRTAGYTVNSAESDVGHVSGERNVLHAHNNPLYMHPSGVESAVASLVDPSIISTSYSSGVSATRPVIDTSGPTSKRHIADLVQRTPNPHELGIAQDMSNDPGQVPLSPTPMSHLKRKAVANSPRQSEAASFREDRSLHEDSPVHLGASGIPDLNDPIPEIGHGIDAVSEGSSIRSVPRAPSSLKENRETWTSDGVDPTRDTRYFSFENNDDASISSRGPGRKTPLKAAAAGLAAGTAAGMVAKAHSRSPSTKSPLHHAHIEDEYENEHYNADPGLSSGHLTPMANVTPTNGHAAHDEGYVSGAYARSHGTPKAHAVHDRDQLDEELVEDVYADETADLANDDPFVNDKRVSNMSGMSQGMGSPLYDSATGKGMDRIQSQDVVALMDHLTVRDGQRNARDTEILVTLVRNAAEMRQSFDEMKRFIAEQNRMNMKHTDRDADLTVQKVLTGQRMQKQPLDSLRSQKSADEDDSEYGKRKNVFKRALRGFGGRDKNDLGRVEQMLMQLLNDVETLKDAQNMHSQPISSTHLDHSPEGSRRDTISSYEALRAHADSGYEPEGRPGTGSTHNPSVNFQLSPPPKQGFHSGYDGRRDSINRVSTVMEGEDEDEYSREEQLTPKPTAAQRISPSFDNRRGGIMFNGTPPLKDYPEQGLERTPEKQRKHNSTGSSNTGAGPKVSRWSRTTASSVPDGYIPASPAEEEFASARQSREQRPLSNATLSDRSLHSGNYQDDHSIRSIDSPRQNERLRSDARSLHSQGTDMTRTPSPLIPSEASASRQRNYGSQSATPSPHLDLPEDEDDIDDPKYQAVRNSLLLEHPQPRQGPTHRHQTNLESQAVDFGPSAGSLTGSDLSQRTVESDFDPSQWGSNPALSLGRAQKLGRIIPHANDSPTQSPANSSPRSTKAHVDDSPLLPIQRPDPESHSDRTYQRSQAPPRTFDRLYYSSPLGSGHLLEPIEEVRYSLENSSGMVTPGREVTPEPTVMPKVDRSKLNPVRKITGPRPMVRNVSGSSRVE